MMQTQGARWLRCPHCGEPLDVAPGVLRCPRGHSFDVARQGYVNLSAAGPAAGAPDTPAMVDARDRFLGGGHFAPLVDAVVRRAARSLDGGPPGCVLDVGAGTGHYLARVLERAADRDGIALDLSKAAARRAARAHARITAVVHDAARRLPLAEGTAALVLNVFAPRNGPELRRVLHDAGTLLVVTPTARHLHELVAALDLLTVDPRKQERLAEKLGPHFDRADEEAVEVTRALAHDEVLALVQMGPSAWHAEPAELQRKVAALPDPCAVTLSFSIGAYRPRPSLR